MVESIFGTHDLNWCVIVKMGRSRKHHQASDVIQLHDLIIDYSIQGFAIWDNHLELIDWNKKCAEFWYASEKMLFPGLPMTELLQHIAKKGGLGEGDPVFLAEKEYRRIQKSGPDSTDQFTMLDGRIINVQRSSLKDGGHVSTYTDVTQQYLDEKRIQETEKRFQTLYQQSPYGVTLEDYSQVKQKINELILKDVREFEKYFTEHEDVLKSVVMDIRLLDANKAMLRMVGANSLEEYIQYEDDYDLWKDSSWKNFYIKEITALAEGNSVFEDLYYDTSLSGDEIIIRCTSQIVIGHEDDWSEIITIHENITESTRAKTQILESLSKEQEASRAKSDFLANMSHELRTPLNAIIGFSDSLKNEIFGSVGNQKNKEYLNHIAESGSHLLRIISDILDLSKIEAREETLYDEEIIINELINECQNMMNERAIKNDVRLTFDNQNNHIVMVADRLKIKQILLNLLSNAIKFTQKYGEVRTGVVVNADNSLNLYVKDTGIGIPSKDVASVMMPFAQVGEATTRSHEGTGLGLALVKSLTELHGGNVEIMSTEGKGTTVTIMFPPERTKVF